mmetsp:Transcript_17842/g.50241  ORF Transcript_17842/g.50241 Transcript_17842/m.50241 type:complete len:357 (-) Transcript_17842:259-1329(-)|eukprot:CAMPEP_0119129080 /NCGR_PEP_ID=MMETSP1310-20130426/6980_1 /TAXON_ID=464262 /ORGANISM="Genus nov. species nov., Strain RCC2339" /LENGTH=356 /DNA_ID=CAMNT_0007119483 /DNA_START=43 /DNA_END=1113 /DNA_ORIENTATION=-
MQGVQKGVTLVVVFLVIGLWSGVESQHTCNGCNYLNSIFYINGSESFVNADSFPFHFGWYPDSTDEDKRQFYENIPSGNAKIHICRESLPDYIMLFTTQARFLQNIYQIHVTLDAQFIPDQRDWDFWCENHLRTTNSTTPFFSIPLAFPENTYGGDFSHFYNSFAGSFSEHQLFANGCNYVLALQETTMFCEFDHDIRIPDPTPIWPSKWFCGTMSGGSTTDPAPGPLTNTQDTTYDVQYGCDSDQPSCLSHWNNDERDTDELLTRRNAPFSAIFGIEDHPELLRMTARAASRSTNRPVEAVKTDVVLVGKASKDGSNKEEEVAEVKRGIFASELGDCWQRDSRDWALREVNRLWA